MRSTTVILTTDVMDVIQEHYRRRGLRGQEARPDPKVIRGSAIGKGLRALFLKATRSHLAKSVDPRGMRVFELGHQRHFALRRALRDAYPTLPLGDPTGVDGEEGDAGELEVTVPLGDGYAVVGHIDGCVPVQVTVADSANSPTQEVSALLEIKTMAPIGFKNFAACFTQEELKAELSQAYWGQAQFYMGALGVLWCAYLAENKENGQLAVRHIAFDPDGYAGLLAKAALLKTWLQAHATGELGADLMPDPCEGKDYGAKPTADQELAWGCSYCPFWQTCYPGHVAIMRPGRFGPRRVTILSSHAKGAEILERGFSV
jgi:hypothetical protein